MSSLIQLLDRFSLAITQQDKHTFRQSVGFIQAALSHAFEQNESDAHENDDSKYLQYAFNLEVRDEKVQRHLDLLNIIRYLPGNNEEYKNKQMLEVLYKTTVYKPQKYNLSFITNRPSQQLEFGKAQKISSFNFFSYSTQMETYYWDHDDNQDQDDDEYVRYLTTHEKKSFKVKCDPSGRLIRGVAKTLVQKNEHFMYVVSPKGGLYLIAEGDCVGTEGLLEPHHSMIRAGQPILCGGMLHTDENGEIKQIDAESGHYRPDKTSFLMACLHLNAQGILKNDCMMVSSGPKQELLVCDLIQNEEHAVLRQKYAAIMQDAVHDSGVHRP